MLFYGVELMQKICMGKYLKIEVRIINLRPDHSVRQGGFSLGLCPAIISFQSLSYVTFGCEHYAITFSLLCKTYMKVKQWNFRP